MSAFEARYGGECNECGSWFEPGTRVRYDETRSIVHAEPDECMSEVEYERARHSDGPCPLCYCYHAGECA